eukprot:GHVU01110851.1.p1 GENE.GHVU01110851.1~~GHVU01110851.1.p1  ORF type:complete len:264 (+),score=34.52 GHVU01110851.1:27-794(+)
MATEAVTAVKLEVGIVEGSGDLFGVPPASVEDRAESTQRGLARRRRADISPKDNPLLRRVEGETGEVFYEFPLPPQKKQDLMVDMVEAGLSCNAMQKVFASIVRTLGHADVLMRPQVDRLKAAWFTQALCLYALQLLALLLRASPAFAFGADVSTTDEGQPLLGVRLRLMLDWDIHNLHLLLVPLFESETAAELFDHVVPVMDALCRSWRLRTVGFASDGGGNMSGKLPRAVASDASIEACVAAVITRRRVSCGE